MAPISTISRDELLHQLVHDRSIPPESARDMAREAELSGTYTEFGKFHITFYHSIGGKFTIEDIK